MRVRLTEPDTLSDTATEGRSAVVRFEIGIAEEKIADLKRRLRAARLPAVMDAESWADGASLAFLCRLADYWRDKFQWRAQEARLNRLPQYLATIQGMGVHFVHQPGQGPAPLPLILTHGWPGSFIEMERLIPLLSDPGAHGGDPGDAFHVVVPSLPGYGFSQAPAEPGVHAGRIAAMWHSLMRRLGYDRFAAQGGDIGAGVAAWLARLFPDSVAGIHLNYIPASYRPPLDEHQPPVTAEERVYRERAGAWAATEGAYAALQATKPQTLAYALTDSPIGLAAWFAEKFQAWSDCGGDIESVFSMDELLTNISLYWFGNTLSSSLRLYKENQLHPLVFEAGERVRPPLGVALFPRELPTPPRSWVARVFNVHR
ncbi:MAG: epoxide hydrolase family protein, partial [Terracidiphilus sp.]